MRLFIVLISLWFGYLFSNPIVAARAFQETMPLSRLLNQTVMQYGAGATVGVLVKSMRYSDTLYSHHANTFLVPASTAKILTAQAALMYLGRNYRFATQLLTDAHRIHAGILHGNLYVLLSGDPSLTYSDIVELFMVLKAKHIRAITGNVYIDNMAYDKSFYGPGWKLQDKSYCYAAPISTGMVNHNCLSFKITPNKVGRYAKIMRSHDYFYPAIKNTVVTKRFSRTCAIHISTHLSNLTVIDGCMPKGRYTVDISYVIPNIPDYDRNLIKRLLSRLSVRVYGHVTFKSAPLHLVHLATHVSEPLHVLIHEMLKKSDNVIAGALFKKLGQLYVSQPGSWQKGRFAVLDILSKYAHINTKGMRLLDGSGLSRYNVVTASQMMAVLNFAYHHALTHADFFSALPIAGIDGTMKHRLLNVAGRTRAKTGTLSGVVSLAGYAMNANREQIAFVIIINGKDRHYRYKLLEDKIVTLLVQSKRL